MLAFVAYFGVMFIALGLSMLWGQQFYGTNGIIAAIVSWGLVITGGLVSLIVSAVYMNTPHAGSANLFGMLPRMAVPLVALIGLGKVWPAWSTCDGPNVLMACYLVSLTVEVFVAVRLLTVANPKTMCEKSSAPSTTAMGA